MRGLLTPSDGLASLEEMILHSDIVARARLRSVTAITEYYSFDPAETGHYGVLSHLFDIQEYLVGTGDSQITAMVYLSKAVGTAEEGLAIGQRLLQKRDTQWDNRDAIIFLFEWEPGRYSLGFIDTSRGDRYSIASVEERGWLPAARSGGATGIS